jgi:hypothetical protein
MSNPTPVAPPPSTNTVEILPPTRLKKGRFAGIVVLCILGGVGAAILRRSPDVRTGILPNAPTADEPADNSEAIAPVPTDPPVAELSQLVSEDLANGQITQAILRLQAAQADPEFNRSCAVLETCERWQKLYDAQSEVAVLQAASNAKRRDDLITKAESKLPKPPEVTYLEALTWIEGTLVDLVAGQSKEDPRIVLNDVAGTLAALESEWKRQEWAIAARANPNNPPELLSPPAGRVNLSNLAGMVIDLRRVGQVSREAGIESQIRAARQAQEAAESGIIPEELP